MAVVPGAKVTITEINTGLSRSVETNSSGYYVFANLEAGVYRTQVEHAGFKTAVLDRELSSKKLCLCSAR